jgi:hypothetical protein
MSSLCILLCLNWLPNVLHFHSDRNLTKKVEAQKLKHSKHSLKKWRQTDSVPGKGDHFSMLGLSPQAQEKKVRQTIKP